MFGKAALGGIMMVVVRLLTRFSDLITMLILARMLEPKSFGLVAIASSITVIFESALELPVSAVLLRQKELSKPLYDTAFTLSVARGAAIGVLTIALSLPFAEFYHNPQLAPLVCALALSPIFRGLYSPGLAAFQIKLSFWRDVTIEAGGKAVASSAAITVALVTHSYWAIAVGTIFYPISMVAISYCLAPYRPGVSLIHWRDFLDYLGWNSAAQIISAVNWQSERLLLGRLQTPAQLGLFSTGNDIAGIPFASIFGPIIRPLYAVFAHARHDPAQLRVLYERTSAALLAIGLPILVGESCVAEPTVRLILGTRWLGAAPLVHWLGLSFIPAVYAMAAGPLFMAFGHTKLLFRRNVLEFACKMPTVILGAIEYGFWGVIFARLFSEVIADGYCLLQVRHLIGLSFRQQILAGWRSPISAFLLGTAVTLCNIGFVGRYDQHPVLQLAILVPVGAITYLASHLILWILVGRPDGIEALAIESLEGLLDKMRGRARFSPSELGDVFVSETIDEMAVGNPEQTPSPPAFGALLAACVHPEDFDELHRTQREKRLGARRSLEQFLTNT